MKYLETFFSTKFAVLERFQKDQEKMKGVLLEKGSQERSMKQSRMLKNRSVAFDERYSFLVSIWEAFKPFLHHVSFPSDMGKC